MKKIKSMSINGKAVAMCKMGGGIMFGKPNTYEVLEYLESNGKQYVDTGYIPNQDTAVEAAFYDAIGNGPELSKVVMGTEYATANCIQIIATRKTNSFQRFIGKIYVIKDFTFSNQSHTVKLDKNYCTVDGEQNDWAASLVDEEITCPLLIFGVTNTENRNFVGRVFNAKIWQSDTLVRDFIPVRRLSDGELGMYDTVTKQFFTNQGTGTFTAGEPTGRKF